MSAGERHPHFRRRPEPRDFHQGWTQNPVLLPVIQVSHTVTHETCHYRNYRVLTCWSSPVMCKPIILSIANRRAEELTAVSEQWRLHSGFEPVEDLDRNVEFLRKTPPKDDRLRCRFWYTLDEDISIVRRSEQKTITTMRIRNYCYCSEKKQINLILYGIR